MENREDDVHPTPAWSFVKMVSHMKEATGSQWVWGSSGPQILADSWCHSGWMGKASWASRAASKRHPGWHVTQSRSTLYNYDIITLHCKSEESYTKPDTDSNCARWKEVICGHSLSKLSIWGKLQSIGDDWQELVAQLHEVLYWQGALRCVPLQLKYTASRAFFPLAYSTSGEGCKTARKTVNSALWTPSDCPFTLEQICLQWRRTATVVV